jgi:2-oxoglutarate ferredoxin oxidoreductase subunit alpha
MPAATEQRNTTQPSPRTDRANGVAPTLSIAIAGSGGSGVMTAGTLLLDAAAKAGLYGLMVRTSGPQIRGGEAAALVRLAPRSVASLDDRFDLLIAIDWQNVSRFADEIALGPSSVIVGDADAGEAPDVFRATGARYVPLPLKKTMKGIPGSWINMIALGLAGALAGLPETALEAALRASWKRADAALPPNLAALRAGIAAAAGIAGVPKLAQSAAAPSTRWLLSGNEAAGYGALRGGIRFVAAYPITPATEMLEWMAPALAKVGGTLLQAEDELASVNMIIGASYGGVPSLTATAGPGLALMTEGIGLAVAAEVPIVVVDVMRGGPSTGIPAKSEQSDLSFAVSGLHGDAPRLVLAPTSIADCRATTRWAVELAETLQAPAIVLSDQFMGQSRAIIDAPADGAAGAAGPPTRLTAAANTPGYQRYADTESGVSPMAVPGTPGVVYTADGLEHTEAGIPSSQARAHAVQLDKRERKLVRHDYGSAWADIDGDGACAIVTFGSASGPVREAAARAAARGCNLRVIVLRLLAPARPEQMAAALDGVERVLVVEQNHGAQLFRYLRALYDLPGRPESFHRPGPLPLRPGELADAIVAWSSR